MQCWSDYWKVGTPSFFCCCGFAIQVLFRRRSRFYMAFVFLAVLRLLAEHIKMMQNSLIRFATISANASIITWNNALLRAREALVVGLYFRLLLAKCNFQYLVGLAGWLCDTVMHCQPQIVHISSRRVHRDSTEAISPIRSMMSLQSSQDLMVIHKLVPIKISFFHDLCD